MTLSSIEPQNRDYEVRNFECPSCGNNALTDESGAFKYIDFQNFLLRREWRRTRRGK